jgi:hypothetical protein
MAIHYIDNLRWFSPKRSSAKYNGVSDALKAHIDYIKRQQPRRGREAGVYAEGLDRQLWQQRCDDLLSKNRRSRVAAKTCFALPLEIDARAGAALVQEFFSTQKIFHEQFKRDGKKYTQRCTLPAENIGVAVHDGFGISRHRNPHAHIVIFPRSRRGNSLDIQRQDLSRLHQKWREFLKEKGFQLRDDPAGKGPHVGPDVLRHDKEARDAYTNRLYANYLSNLVELHEREDKRYETMKEAGMGYLYDLEKIKSVSIEDLLSHENIAFDVMKDRVMFKAPWRDEKTASVSAQEVDGRWLFVDHGDKQHSGSMIDLVMQIKNISFQEALDYINQNIMSSAVSRDQKKDSVKEKKKSVNALSDKMQIVKTFDKMSAKSEAILKKERGLSWADLYKRGARIAKILFASNGKTSIKIFYQNDSGGHELKDAKPGVFSGVIGHKDLSWHPLKNSSDLLVAESLLDAVAAQKLIGKECSILSLNSTRMAGRAIDKIVAERPDKVLLSLDNDGPGREAATEIEAACKAAGIAVETAWPPAGEAAKDPCAALAQVSFTTSKRGVLTAPRL